MFERMVLSTAGRPQRRLSKFFLGSSIAYILLAGSALAVSICISDPKLTGSGVELRTTHFLAVSGGGSRRVEGPRAAVPPRQNPYHVESLDKIINKVRAGITPPQMPPRLGDFIDPTSIGPGGPGGGSGDGESSGPGFMSGPGMADPPPVPREPRRDPETSDSKRQKTPGLVAVSQPVLQGKAIFRKTPEYPALARMVKKEGSVVVEVVISSEGRVESARAVSGDPLLAPTAVAAAREWKFQPTYLGNVPVRVAGAITFVFRLGQ